MKIQSLSFLGIRGLRDASFDLTQRESGAPHDVVVFTGRGASGKTRALEAIVATKEAIAPYGPMVPGAPWIAVGSPVAKIKIAFHLDDEEMTFARASSKVVEAEVTFHPQRARGEADDGLIALLGRYSHDPALGKLEYFPAARRIPVLPPFGGLGTAEQRLLRAGKDARKYGFVVRFLRDLEGEPLRAQAFAALLEGLSPSLRYVAQPSEGLPRCLSSHGGLPVTPADISDSEADAVIFAATAVGLGLGRSLLLIDRPDQYVDAAFMKRFVTGLRALGQGNQLVLASSSPELIEAATPGAVLTLE
ncbi:MAG: hypothetical protein QM820_05290 [Minicystis sp.]